MRLCRVGLESCPQLDLLIKIAMVYFDLQCLLCIIARDNEVCGVGRNEKKVKRDINIPHPKVIHHKDLCRVFT